MEKRIAVWRRRLTGINGHYDDCKIVATIKTTTDCGSSDLQVQT